MEELEFNYQEAEKFVNKCIENQKNKELNDPNNFQKFKTYYTGLATGFNHILYILKKFTEMLKYIQDLEQENEILQSRIKQLEQSKNEKNGYTDRFKKFDANLSNEEKRYNSISNSMKKDNWY